MLPSSMKVKEVKEVRNIEAANQLLRENWKLLEIYQRDNIIWYVLAQLED